MKPTRWAPLVIITAVGLAVGWVAVMAVDRLGGRVLGVPPLAAVALWLLALAVLVWAVVSRGALVDPTPRGQATPAPMPGGGQPSGASRPVGTRRRMPPLVAARTAALAMAASRTGALIGGFYFGIALALVPVLGTPSGSGSFAAAVAALAACALLVGAAIWLESMCRIRDDERR